MIIYKTSSDFDGDLYLTAFVKVLKSEILISIGTITGDVFRIDRKISIEELKKVPYLDLLLRPKFYDIFDDMVYDKCFDNIIPKIVYILEEIKYNL